MRCLCSAHSGKAPQAFCCAFNPSLPLNPQPGAVALRSMNSREMDTLLSHALSFYSHFLDHTLFLVQLHISPSFSQHSSTAYPSFVCISATANWNIDEPHLTSYRCVSSFFNILWWSKLICLFTRAHVGQSSHEADMYCVCGASCFPPSCGLGGRDKTLLSA